MKIEINHPENIPPPRNLSNPLNKLNTSEIIPTPSESISTPPKNLNPSRKNHNLPEKLPLLKNSITITETISNTQTKSQPLPEKSQPPCEKFSIPPEKISTPYPLKNFSTLFENVLTPAENFTCNHPESLLMPLNNSHPPGIFHIHLENFATLHSPKKISIPPEYNLNPFEKI